MNKEQLAALLDGREIDKEITKAEEDLAKAHGLVVVFGYSDDNVELRGAIHDEVGAWEGTTLTITPTGLVEDWEQFRTNAEDEKAFRDYFAKKSGLHADIKAVWAPANRPSLSWAYETTIPHSTFRVFEDGEVWCIGIVFSLNELTPKAEPVQHYEGPDHE